MSVSGVKELAESVAIADTEEKEKGISEEEATQYDRQIRLWGLAAQNRLHSTRVLSFGVTGLAAEVCKNLVLAGIKAVTLVDHQQLTEQDLGSNFLASNRSVGSNRAEASVQRLQQLNPRVEVASKCCDIAQLSDDDLDQMLDHVDILLAADLVPGVSIRLNEACRRRGVKFFAGQVSGFFGFFFVDLIEHKFIEEVLKTSGTGSGNDSTAVALDDGDEDDGQTSSKKARVEEIPELVKVEQSMSFVSFTEALKTDKLSKRRLKRMDDAFFLMHILLEFESQEQRKPCDKDEDQGLLKSIKSSIESKFNRSISDDLVSIMALQPVSPVCAIVGGTMAQEMIKVVAGQARPHDNFFLFNPNDSAGVIQRIGYDQ